MTTADHETTGNIVGRQLGRYTCMRALGSGGMADLYLAQRAGAKGFTKVFALKRIKEKYAADANFTRMFMREAKLSSTLDHPNIAQVVDFGQDGQEFFLVMEYVHGPDLRRLLRLSDQGRLPLACAMAIITRVCAALHYAHDKVDADGVHLGLVHRDVSATNVLLSMDGAVKLTDFGIAKGFGEDVSGTSSGMLVGKPGYMSPEQVRCETLDRRSDVFCLGILLYEITTGHRCFFGDSVFAVLNATQRARYTDPRKRDPLYPDALAAILAKALQPDPDQRHGSARELQLELEDFALDNRVRTSDTVLTDYLSSLDIELEDASSTTDGVLPSGTSVQQSGGTAFMLSGGVEAGVALPDMSSQEDLEPLPARPSLAKWVAVGAGLAVAAGLLLVRPWESSDASLSVSDDTSPRPQMSAATPAAAAPSEVVHEVEDEPAVQPDLDEAGDPEDSGSAEDVVEIVDDPAPEADADVAAPVADAPPVTKRRRAKKKKRNKPGATKGNSELDALAPPSRRRD